LLIPGFTFAPKNNVALIVSLNECFLQDDVEPVYWQVLASQGLPVARSEISEEDIIAKIRNVEMRYGIQKDLMLSVIQCESGFKHDGLWGDNGMAYGIAQFHEDTFYEYAFKGMNYYDLEDQIELAGWMFANGLQQNWSCYNLMYKP